jgi:hypothetical protein
MMTASEPSLVDLIAALGDALERERAVLLSGRPAEIDAVVQQKLALAEAIERHGAVAPGAMPDATSLQALARYNRENSVICGAILRHMTGALDRLRQRDPHRSYGPDGNELNPPSQRLVGAA